MKANVVAAVFSVVLAGVLGGCRTPLPLGASYLGKPGPGQAPPAESALPGPVYAHERASGTRPGGTVLHTISSGRVTEAVLVGRAGRLGSPRVVARALAGVVTGSGQDVTESARPYVGIGVSTPARRGWYVEGTWRGHPATVERTSAPVGSGGTGGTTATSPETSSMTGWVNHLGATLGYAGTLTGRLGWYVGAGPEFAWTAGDLPSAQGFGALGEVGLLHRLSPRTTLRVFAVTHAVDLDLGGSGALWVAGGALSIGVDL